VVTIPTCRKDLAMIRGNPRTRGALLAALALAALAACSSGGPHTSAGTSPTSNDQEQALTVGRQFAQCARAHGRPNFPDPAIQNGTLAFPGVTKQDQAAVQAACRSILQQLPASMQYQNQAPSAQDMAHLQQFAQCVRRNGVTDWPDPKADGTFPIVGTPLETEGKSARVLNAQQACKQYWDKGINAS
jgi:hypothetical protein